jgi:hypothetical protein
MHAPVRFGGLSSRRGRESRKIEFCVQETGQPSAENPVTACRTPWCC